jgi:serine/threonine-protein kinase ULK/ATG1
MYADIWSIGIVFYQMIFGYYLFTGPSDGEIRKKIKIRNIEYPKNIKTSENAKDFIERCLTIDPNLRISWVEIYSHPLIASNNNLLFNLSISK